MVFKTDKNFVTKVALRGFAPPQLLRQFCLRQNRFYGLKRLLGGRPHWGAFGGKMKRKLVFCIFIIFLTSIKSFAQNTDLKYYSDYEKGFSGCSVAVYCGNLSELEAIGQEQEFLDYLDEEIGDKLNSIWFNPEFCVIE